MNTRNFSFSRFYVCSSLLLSLAACSDSTQFGEQTLPGGQLDAEKPAEVVATNEPEMENKTVSEEETLNEDDPTGVKPTGSTANNPVTSQGSTNPGSNPSSGTNGPIVITSGPATPDQVFGVCGDNPDMNIVAQLYQLPTTTQKLPDFSTMNSIGDVCVAQLNIADRSFTQGFPGVSNIFEWFALDMRFKLNVTKAGTYQFYLNSDDGSILSIDNALVIDNDGTHSQREKSASKYLGVGIHDVQLKYYQGPRDRIALELFWKVPGSNNKVYVPKSVMSRP